MRRRIWPAMLIATAVGALVCLPAAAGAGSGDWRVDWPPGRAAHADDPLERLNRGLYTIHRGLERVIVRPVMFVLLGIAPNPLQRGVHNVLANLGEPVTAVNDILQQHLGRAATATARFVSNSTLGVLGLLDVAADHGLAYHRSDFGQTLGRYGLPAGPYVFIPVLGPTTVRDFGGRFVDGALDPVGHIRFDGDSNVGDARTVLGTMDTEATTGVARQDIERRGGDSYVAVRTAYLDARYTAIHGPRTEYARAAPPQSPVRQPAVQSDASAYVAWTFFRPVD